MTDGEPEVSNFAEFEAAAVADEPVEAKEPEPKAEEPPAPDPDGEDDDPDGDPETNDSDEPEKRRSKPAHQRIAELTRQMREHERRANDAEAKLAGQPKPETTTDLVAPDPNDDKYEFGEADPKYLADLTDYKVDLRLADRDKAAETKAVEAEQGRVIESLNTSWHEQAAKGAEKYPDFNAKVLDTAAAGEWPCPPLVAAAISVSPVGTDAAYYLATNPEQAELIAAQLATDPLGAARKFGEIEGAFLDKKPEAPGAGAHPLDLALYAGRLAAFVDKKAKPAGKVATDAPEPPANRVRGAGGQFEVDGSTSDFAAFEKKANATASARR